MALGLIAGALGGGCYLVSLALLTAPIWSVAFLLLGRTLLGGAESLIITSGMLWGLGLVAAHRSAKVIAWVGMSMFAAMAVGAPIGSALYARFAFLGIALVSTIIPLAGLAIITPLRPLIPSTGAKGDVRQVLSAVLLPGLGFALSGITFGATTAFLTLYFAAESWAHGALAFTIFAVALIAARIVGGQARRTSLSAGTGSEPTIRFCDRTGMMMASAGRLPSSATAIGMILKCGARVVRRTCADSAVASRRGATASAGRSQVNWK